MSVSLNRSFLILLISLLILSGCTSVSQKTANANRTELDVTIANSMNKDAVRLSVEILQVEKGDSQRNTYRVSVKRLVKYGATFSSATPQVGDTIILSTPRSVVFKKGNIVLMDVMTPRTYDGQTMMKVRLA